MNELTPIYRIEYFLDAVVNGTVCPYAPIYRIEFYLARLAGADVTIPEPIYRIEFYLAKLCGADVTIPEPIYRAEFYLAKACGMEVEVPNPIYRMEFWLAEMANGSDPLITLRGSLVRFTSSKSKPFVSTEVSIVPQQSGSGDPSPDNIRPISGWDAVKVTRTGKNLIDVSSIYSGLPSLDIGSSYDAITPSTRYGYSEMGINAGVTISVRSTDTDKFDWCVILMYNSGKLANRVYFYNIGTTQTYIVNQSYEKIRIVYGAPSGVNIGSDLSSNEIQVTLGSTASPYSPYSGTSLLIPFTVNGETKTVYGGTLTINEDGSGELTVDRAMVDLGTLSWVYRASNLAMETSLEGVKSGTNVPAICSNYKNNTTATGWVSIVNGEFTIRNGSMRIRDEAYTDAAIFKAAMSGVQLCYELATPIVTTLTAQQINTLVGENNVWADSGDIEVTVYGFEPFIVGTATVGSAKVS